VGMGIVWWLRLIETEAGILDTDYADPPAIARHERAG
jgi:hypothetical protein